MRRFFNTLRRDAERYRNLVQRVANWPTYFAIKFGLRRDPVVRFRLRPGGAIEVPLSRILEFKQSFFGDVYTAHLPPTSGKGDIIDIGANVGCFTVFAATVLPCDRVLAFEPDPINFQQLQRNAELSSGRPIVAIDAAVCDTVGEITFFNQPTRGFTIGGTVLTERGLARGYSGLTVPSTTLQEIFRQHDVKRCSLLKLDCEGSEFEIFETVADEILARIDQIAAEVHVMPGRSMELITSRLRRAGFECRTAGLMLWAWRPSQAEPTDSAAVA